MLQRTSVTRWEHHRHFVPFAWLSCCSCVDFNFGTLLSQLATLTASIAAVRFVLRADKSPFWLSKEPAEDTKRIFILARSCFTNNHAWRFVLVTQLYQKIF